MEEAAGKDGHPVRNLLYWLGILGRRNPIFCVPLSSERTTTMEKRKTFIINFLFFAIILAAAYVLVRFGLPLLMPFVIAFVIAYFLKRPIRFLSSKLKLPRKLIAILLVILFYGTIGTLLTLLVIRAISSVTTLVQNLPWIFRDYIVPFLTGISANLEDSILRLDPRLLDTLESLSEHLIQSLGQLASSISLGSMSFLSGLASSLPMLFIKTLLMVISTFFLAMDYGRITVFLVRQLNRPARNLFLQIKKEIEVAHPSISKKGIWSGGP